MAAFETLIHEALKPLRIICFETFWNVKNTYYIDTSYLMVFYYFDCI